MLKRFLKQQFIAFYYDKTYKFLKEIYKNNKLIDEEYEEFENKKTLIEKIKNLSSKIPQTYTSTIIQSANQGIIPSCEKKEFLQRKIELENLKHICIHNKYAIFTSLFDLIELKKLNIDFIYSSFAIIDYKAEKKINHLYLLLTKTYFYLVIYYKNLPIYFNIFESKENSTKDLSPLEDEIDDEIEDIDIDLDIDEDIEEIETEPKDEIKTSFELDIINFLKSSLEEYYKNYAEDFIEEAIILDNNLINENISSLIKDSLFIESKIKKIDILKIINEISRKNV